MTSFGLRLMRGRVLHKEALVAKLLGTLLRVQDNKEYHISRLSILNIRHFNG